MATITIPDDIHLALKEGRIGPAQADALMLQRREFARLTKRIQALDDKMRPLNQTRDAVENAKAELEALVNVPTPDEAIADAEDGTDELFGK